jgi:hypothetical protein
MSKLAHIYKTHPKSSTHYKIVSAKSSKTPKKGYVLIMLFLALLPSEVMTISTRDRAHCGSVFSPL